MRSKTLSTISLVLASGLLLAGCAGANTDEPSEGNTDNPVATGPSYTEKWDEKRPEDLLFPRGEYAFTYRENNSQEGLPAWNGEGTIGFYEDGTCAFKFEGTKTSPDGKEITYILGKVKEDSPFLSTSESQVWNNDQLLIESDYRTNFPSMGAFPRHKNFASFCSLQALEDLTTTGNAEVGQRRWTLEGGEEFAKQGKEWFMDYNLFALEIKEEDKAEALEILELMFYGTENIFTFEGEVKIEKSDNGVVRIVNGIEDKTSVFSEFIMTPLSQPMELTFPTVGGMEPALTIESAGGYVRAYEGGGIGYLREVKKLFDEFASENPGNSSTD